MSLKVHILNKTCFLVFTFYVIHSTMSRQDPFLTYPTNIEDMKKLFKMERPTIGILSLFVAGRQILEKVPQAENCSYIAASFVRFVECAGARVVAIPENLKDNQVNDILKKVNGAIIPGGDIAVMDSGYNKISEMIYRYSINQKRRGVIWPVLAINRGAQRLSQITAGKDVTVSSDSMNLSLPLHFTPGAKKSRLMKHAAKGIWKTFATRPMTFNVHARALLDENFTNSTELMNFYRIISTNKDRNGTIFVSTFEAKHYPIYCFQWQPEKISFVWNPVLSIDHSPDAIRAAQYIANYFVVESRMNAQRFRTRADEEPHLMYQRKPVYIGNILESPYEQIYLFKNANGTKFGKHLPESFYDLDSHH